MRGRSAAIAAVLLGLALGLAACSDGENKVAAPTTLDGPTSTSAGNPRTTEANDPGDIPDDQVFVPYKPPTGGYSLKVPEGWARTQPGEAVVFTDKLNSIRMETVPAAAAPTVDSARQDELPAIQKASPGFEAGKVTQVKRKAGMAVFITYRADGQPNEVTGKLIRLDVERYEFWRAGTEVILTLSGPKGADNVDPWKIVTDSFAWG
ncbi:MAG: PsbP-related protein [Acidimicrobiales bacterium]